MTFDTLAEALRRHQPAILDDRALVPAAVSCILRHDASGFQLLFIERSAHEADPWSGNISFPGGKLEENDAGLRQTAERETGEEVGIDLRTARYLGRLSDVGGRTLRVRVACFVYGLEREPSLTLSDEVRDAFWIPLKTLLDRSYHQDVSVRFDDRAFIRPAFVAVPAGKPPLWGLTYRLVAQFIEILREVDDRSPKVGEQ